MAEDRSAIIIGAGNLGRAIIRNFKFSSCGVSLRAAFDLKESFTNWDPSSPQLYDISELDSYLKGNPTDIAVLTLPGFLANETAAKLVACGIKGIWNFTNVELTGIPEDVVVENVHFSDSLLALGYYLSQNGK